MDMAPALLSCLLGVVDVSRRAAGWILGVAVGVAALLLFYIPTHLSLDTDPLNLLDPSLPFRQSKTDFARAFPQLTNLVVVVVDADHADQAEEAAGRLAGLLGDDPNRFGSVYVPGEERFFRRHGLLYMKKEELLKLDERLSHWAPFLDAVFRDPSLRGLFSMLGPALDKTRRLAQNPELGSIFSMVEAPSGNMFLEENQARLTRMLDWIDGTITAQLGRQPNPRFWRETILEGLDTGLDGNRRFVLVKPRLDYSGLRAAEETLTVLRRWAHVVEAEHEVRVRLTGELVLQEEERETVGTGAGLAAVLSLSLVCLIVFVGLRSPRLAASIGVTLLLGLVWTAGFATVTIGTLNMISATAPVLFIGLGVDFGIQFGLRYNEVREQGISHETALQETVRSLGSALTLAAISAVISFVSFLPTKYRGLAELGFIAAGGMWIALLANLTLLPALLTLFPIRVAPASPPSSLRGLPDLILTRRRPILVGAVVLLGGSVAVLPWVAFDFNPLHLKDPSTEGVAAFQELVEDPNSTPYTIQILSQDLDTAQRLAARLETLRAVGKIVTLASFVPREQDEKLEIIREMRFALEPILRSPTSVSPPSDQDNARALGALQARLAVQPGSSLNDALASSMGRLNRSLDALQRAPGWPRTVLPELQERLLSRLPHVRTQLQDLLTAETLASEDLPASVRERYLAPDGRARIEVFPAQGPSDNEAIREFVLAVQTLAPRATGMPVGLVGAGDAVVDACVQATGLALAGVTLLLWVVLRRMSDVLLVLLPLVLTLVLTLAFSVAVRLPLNLANIIALPLVLGLGIAFGIYLVWRAREEASSGKVVRSSTLRAVWYSALTTMASFGTLAIAEHRGMSSMGQLLTVSLALTLLSTLVILPAVMAELESRGWWHPDSVPRRAQPTTDSRSCEQAHE